jgi:23S rRNA (guanosine2251-2'-O)-methyltransferase
LPNDRPPNRDPKKPWGQKPGGFRPGGAKSGGKKHWVKKPPLAGTDIAGPSGYKPPPPPEPEDEGRVRLFGMHPVAAALQNPKRKINKLVLTENAERRLVEAIGALKHPVEYTTPRDLDQILGPDAVHQGAMLETEPLLEPEFKDLIAASGGRPVIVLDQVTDPHNAGAVLRSAAVFGAAGLVMTRRHSPPLNGVLAKSASGALELVPVALVQNLSRALEELKEVGFRVVGLDGGAEARLEELDWSRPTALVMGAEGRGLRELTAKTCDQLARITTSGPIDSLNVSNAAAVALHIAAMARRG